MRKENIIRQLGNRKISGQTKLETFLDYYDGLVEGLYKKELFVIKDAEEEYLVNALYNWVEQEGYPLFYSAIEMLDTQPEEKISGFIELYTFMLLNAESDLRKLADQLFFIPGQFVREFMGEKETVLYG